jgi:hypothetical protein
MITANELGCAGYSAQTIQDGHHARRGQQGGDFDSEPFSLELVYERPLGCRRALSPATADQTISTQLVLGLMAIGSLMMSSLCPPIGASMSECDGRLYVRTIGDCAFSSGSSRNGQPSIIPLGPSL